jgi:ribonucleoside-triphosphate reductase (thioredoxin)
MILDIKDEQRFALWPRFLEDYKSKDPDWGPLGFVTFKRTYARPLENGLSEEWWQTVKRVVEGVYTVHKWHCSKLNLPWSEKKAQYSAQEMFRLVFDMKFLPPGRGLWAMGTSYIEKNGGAPLNNCAFVSSAHIDEAFAAPFCFLMDMSMLGVGVGGDTEGAGRVVIQTPIRSDEVVVIADDREGWVETVRRTLEAYAGEATMPTFDYSGIRPAGEPIKGFGGIAAGPGPLMRCVDEIKKILGPLQGQPITSTAIVDLFNVIGVCVVSGNVRRSAEVMLGRPTDTEFLQVKDPERHAEALMSHRWASNNSIFAEIGMDYEYPAELTARNGEPGYLWLETMRGFGRLKDPKNNKDRRAVGANPCLEQTLENFELCCLVETFPSRHATYEEYQRTLKFAYLYAKTVTLIPTHNKQTNRVMMRNRRIGCSQSGIVQSMARHGRRRHLTWCDNGYAYLQGLDEQYSEWLAVPRSIKMTSVKPSGTVSLLPGVTPGIHYEHSEFYYRTMRIAKTSTLAGPLRAAGYRIEEDAYDPTGYVVYFPVKAEFFDRAKADVTIWEQLENAAAMQHYWADNQVSITVTFKPEEAKDIRRALECYESRLKSVSFLPLKEHGYTQAPYITITQEEYEGAVSGLRSMRLASNTHEAVDAYCDGDRCVVP